MAATLTRSDEALELSLSGCRGSEFQDVLAKAKEVPGRRFDGERKLWLFPNEPAIAERIILAINPNVSEDIEAWVTDSKAATERDLVTPLPDDGELMIPWATARMPWQPQEINGEKVTGLKQHQRALVANMTTRCLVGDDLGLGKTVQALSYVAECLVRYRHDYELNRVQQGLQSQTQTEPGEEKQRQLQETQGGNPSDNQRQEGNSLCGLRDLLASPLYGLGSCEGTDSVLDQQMAGHYPDTWKVQGTDGDRGASEVRRSLSELPSPEALAGRPKLIVCPLSVTGVWQREVKRWLGEDAVSTTGLTKQTRERTLQEGISEGSWVIVNYEQLRIVKEKVKMRNGGTKTVTNMKEPLFEKTEWLACIIDESHRLKNRKALQTRGAYRLKADIMLLLTGTPLMNSPAELWSLLRLLYPEEYTSYWRFFDNYVDCTEGYHGKVINGVKNPDALSFELRNRLYRRTKAQVLDLPEKQRIIVPVELGKKQRELYSDTERNLWIEVEKAVEEGDASAVRLVEAADSGYEIYAITNGAARTVRLRQVNSSPALLGGADDSAKLDAVEEAILDNQHKPHVVFTEFKMTCELLAARLEKEGLTVAIYNGDSSTSQRTEIEDQFQKGLINVVVGTIGAMKEGITLTAADTVHFIERSWVPGWNEQAEDRLHRIGQRNAVTVYIYEATKTVDDGRIKPTNSLKERIVSTVLPKDHVKETSE